VEPNFKKNEEKLLKILIYYMFGFSSGNSIVVEPNIYVTPCLQEMRSTGSIIGNENEQKPSKWVNNSPNYLFPSREPGYATNQYDKIWNGTETIDQVCKSNNIDPAILTKNGLLVIPNFQSYGFTSECKSLKPKDKWAMYTKFLCEKFANVPQGVAFMVSHHNRLKNSFIPLTRKVFKSGGMFGSSIKYGYANNFCLKVEIDVTTKTGNVSIFFEGFPDKVDIKKTGGTFVEGEKEITNIRFDGTSGNYDVPEGDDRDGDEEGAEDQKGRDGQKGGTQIGGGVYKYINDIGVINTDPLKSGIATGLSNTTGTLKKITIYLIRHGNSLHNGPVSAPDQMARLDSTLTPFGMYQAQVLGKKLQTEPCLKDASNKALLCCSFLERTQLTGLLLLEAAGLKLSNGEINSMKERGKTRYKSQSFKTSKFFGFAPLGTKDKSADKPSTTTLLLNEFNGFLNQNGLEPVQVDEVIAGDSYSIPGAVVPVQQQPEPVSQQPSQQQPSNPVEKPSKQQQDKPKMFYFFGGKRKTHRKRKGRKGRKTHKRRGRKTHRRKGRKVRRTRR